MSNMRIKDCVCNECAHRMGYVPRKSVVCVWLGKCDWCEEMRSLTSLYNDWEKKVERDDK